jgi:ribonuclease HI
MENTIKKRLYCVFCVYIKTQRRETRRIRELLDQEKGRIKLMWIPSHSGITANEKADAATKNALEEDINDQKLYPPQDLIN